MSDERMIKEPEELLGLLHEFDVCCRERGAGVPRELPQEVWAGVLFRVYQKLYLVPLDADVEVLKIPAELTAVPGTKPWVLGIANNRGTLLPIFDLASLVQGSSSIRRDSARVLVVRQDALPCGLAVTDVVGIRHFMVTERRAGAGDATGPLAPFVSESFLLGDSPVPVLALTNLMADPLLNAAVA